MLMVVGLGATVLFFLFFPIVVVVGCGGVEDTPILLGRSMVTLSIGCEVMVLVVVVVEQATVVFILPSSIIVGGGSAG